MDLRPGCRPLRSAAIYWGNPRTVRELRRLRRLRYDGMTMAAILGKETVQDRRGDPFCCTLDRMRHDLVTKLWTGALESFAFVKGSDVSSDRARIHPGRWRVLTPNFDDCTASDDGVELIDVWVAAPPATKESASNTAEPGSISTLDAEATVPPSSGAAAPAMTRLDKTMIAAMDDEAILELLEEHAKRVIAGPGAKLIAPGRVSFLPIIKRKMMHCAEHGELLPAKTDEAR